MTPTTTYLVLELRTEHVPLLDKEPAAPLPQHWLSLSIVIR